MNVAAANQFSGPITVFQEYPLPERATPAGYAALIDAYRLNTPLPRTLCAIGERHRIIEKDGWRILTPRHAPQASLEGHLTFALKHEGLDLAVLKRLFKALTPGDIEALVRAKPTGGYARRVWFLYEWLTSRRLDLPNGERGSYVPVVDPKVQWAIEGENSSRHRVRNNLPGTPEFCPLVFRTDALERFVSMDLARRARAVVAQTPREVLARAAAFLLLKDSRSSYAIEGEQPPQDRIQRWGRAIGEAGRRPLDIQELLRLQRIVIGDARFVPLGLRQAGGFVGEHDRETGLPLPVHISARAEDLPSLIEGMLAFYHGPSQRLPPLVSAAILAFGFIYVHPFEDANGRIHRYLIHHVLTQRGFNPPGVVFPVSAAILEDIEAYKQVLEGYSVRLLRVIVWERADVGNVRVLNDTADFYRFFDATPHAEFLYGCAERTIREDLPREADFLRRYDHFRSRIEAFVDMPDNTIDLMFRFLHQNDGRFSKRARTREFSQLSDEEALRFEEIYAETFGDMAQHE